MNESEKMAQLRMKLNAVGCPYHNIPEDDLMEMLFSRDDFFMRLILWACSKLDVELENYFRNIHDPKRELIKTLHELQITKDLEKDKFVRGGLTKDQQISVWFRLLDTVECVSNYEDDTNDAENLETTFEKKQNESDNNISQKCCVPNNKDKIPNIQETDLQDARDKLELTMDNKQTTEIPIYKPTNCIDTETIIPSLQGKLGDLKSILAEYKMKKCCNELNTENHENEGVILVAKIKEIEDQLASSNLFLSYLNNRKNILDRSKFIANGKINLKNLYDQFTKLCDEIDSYKF